MKTADRLGVVDTLCQWNPDPHFSQCPNVATRFYLQKTGTRPQWQTGPRVFISICNDCDADFRIYNWSDYREIPREEAELWEIHND